MTPRHRNSNRNSSGNGTTDTALASLGAQVSALGDDYLSLDRRLTTLDNKLSAGLSELASRFEHSISALSSKFEDRSRPQWAVIWTAVATIISFTVVIGGLAYWPIQKATSDLQTSMLQDQRDFLMLLQKLPDTYVNYREHDRLLRELENQRNELRKDMVTREEHKEHWRAIEQRSSSIEHDAQIRSDALSANIRSTHDSLQREIDDLKRSFSDTYNARDVLLDLRNRLDRVEQHERH